jgi:hypothetical protein
MERMTRIWGGFHNSPRVRILDHTTIMDRLDPQLVRIRESGAGNQDWADWAGAIKTCYISACLT